MGQILVRNLDDAVIDSLKRRAARREISFEEEVRRTLTESAGLEREEFIKKVDAFRNSMPRLPGPDSVELLRESRRRGSER